MTADVFEAVRRGVFGTAQPLPSHIDLRQTNESGQTLLHVAIASKQIDVAQQLVARGIEINAIDDQGQTALHYCAAYHLPTIAQCILQQGGQLSIADRHGNTPLWAAVFNARGDYRLVQVLLEYGGGKFAEVKNRHGRSPLDFARQIGDTALAELLVNHA